MIIYLRRELYIVNNLRVKMLIKNNIIKSKEIIINVVNKKARIDSYSTIINITTRSRGEFVRRKVYIKLSIFVPPHSEIMLSIKEIKLSNDRNFLFKPAVVVQTNLIIFAYLINYTITGILIRNESNISIQISRKLRLKNILEMDYENYFQINIEPKFALTKIIINLSIDLSLN